VRAARPEGANVTDDAKTKFGKAVAAILGAGLLLAYCSAEETVPPPASPLQQRLGQISRGEDPGPSSYRTGAICEDGTRSSATGSGACSRHGGVARWRYSDGSTEADVDEGPPPYDYGEDGFDMVGGR
jgi:hypothetical protein